MCKTSACNCSESELLSYIKSPCSETHASEYQLPGSNHGRKLAFIPSLVEFLRHLLGGCGNQMDFMSCSYKTRKTKDTHASGLFKNPGYPGSVQEFGFTHWVCEMIASDGHIVGFSPSNNSWAQEERLFMWAFLQERRLWSFSPVTPPLKKKNTAEAGIVFKPKLNMAQHNWNPLN